MKKKQTPEETKLKQKAQRLYKTYGLTFKDYNEILIEQNFSCAVCKKVHPRMCVDHVHVLGFKKMLPEEKRKYVRGICCFMCNTSFKAFEKTKDGARNRQMLIGTYEYFTQYKLKGE